MSQRAGPIHHQRRTWGGRGRAILAGVALLGAGCGRIGIDALDLSGGGSGSSSPAGQAASAGAGATTAAAGMTAGTTGGMAGAGVGGTAGVTGSGAGGVAGATPGSGGSGGSSGGTVGSGGASGASPSGGSSGTPTGGVSSGTGGASGVGASGSTSGSAGSGGSGGTSASAGSGGTSGSAGSGGSGGTVALPDVAGGYWLLQASDTGGQVWNNSTLVFTSVASNPDQTYAVSARIDWFEDAGTFGMLLGGEETDEGSYDPISHTLLFDQTGGWASETLDHYQATYDPGSDALIDGFWDTGNPGTISGMRRLSGILLEPPQAQATSQQSGQVAANMVDGDMFTYWSSANNATTGQIITLTLAAPSRLRGLRILSVLSGNAAAPAQLSVSSRDAGGAEVDVSSVAVPNDVMWKPVELVVDELVSELQIEVTALEPAGGNRIVISGLEVFGLP